MLCQKYPENMLVREYLRNFDLELEFRSFFENYFFVDQCLTVFNWSDQLNITYAFYKNAA